MFSKLMGTEKGKEMDQVVVFLRPGFTNALKCNVSANALKAVIAFYSFTFFQKDQMAYLVFSVS